MKRSKIARAMDYLDEDLIVRAAEEKTQSVQPMRTPRRRRENQPFAWRRFAAVAAAGVFLVVGGVGISHFVGLGQSSAIVAFDVNPSLQIRLNDKERVVKVEALNADGEKVLGDMDLKKVELDVAVNAILGSMVKNGYLSVEQNALLISVDADGERGKLLQKSISENIFTMLSNEDIQAAVITQGFADEEEIRKLADELNVSLAKATLLQRVVAAGLRSANGVPYAYEALAKLSVHELKLLLDSKSLSVEGISASGLASEGKLIGSERAVSIAYERASVSVDEVRGLEVELDFDDEERKLLYEVEFRANAKEYEYELDATTGAIVDEEIEDVDDEEEDERLPDGCISEREAVAAAYAHAEVTSGEVIGLECEADGEEEIYEVEFKTRKYKYEYEIDAWTGEILQSSRKDR